jgi:hypothetical protein
VSKSRAIEEGARMAFSCMECMRRFSQIVLIIINIIVVVSSLQIAPVRCVYIKIFTSYLVLL